jgi:hypothetical protein
MGALNDKKKTDVEESLMESTRSIAALRGKPPVYDMIGRRLRGYFDEVAKQPVPDRYLELLNQLESKTSPKKES